MKQNAFIFDINTCVGCMACVAGCSIENGTLAGMNWRKVNGFNTIRHPDLPVFHFSLACNHCEAAPCMKNCPALAYTRDRMTGVVIHHAESCIGCTYCTWACPYDAPKYSTASGVIEKCDFCTGRMAEGLNPACVDACPVGALGFTQIQYPVENEVVPGFADYGIRPSIRLKPLRDATKKPEIWNQDAPDTTTSPLIQKSSKPLTKVDLRKEWTLVIFTLLVAGLTGWMWAHIQSGFPLKPYLFISSGMLGMLLSLAHLGKKLRAWRSLLNIRNSWLSREILSFLALMAFGTLYLYFPNRIFDILTILAGILALGSVDAVYFILQRKEKLKGHSAMTLMTGILVFSILGGLVYLAAFAVTFKFVLYLYRKICYFRKGIPWQPWLSCIRILLLLCIPVTLLFGWLTEPIIILALVASGEIIDRTEFYIEAEVNTPENELHQLFKRYLQ